VTPGLLPAGSLSQAGIELGVSDDAQAWQHWQPREIQLGRATCGGDAAAAFFLMAGVGVEADAVALVRPRLKRRIGKWAYVWALMERLLRPVRTCIAVSVDGRRFRTSQVLVQNGGHYGGPYRVAATDVFSSAYRVLVWKYPGRLMWCVTMGCLMFGLPSAWLAYEMPAMQVRVRSSAGMRCQIDGDTGPGLPLRILPATPREIALPAGARRPEKR